MPHPIFERHAPTIERALTAIGERGYWSPHSESPKAYGEGAMEAGKAAFDALLGKPFDLTQPGHYRVEPQLTLFDVVAPGQGSIPRPRERHAPRELACNAVEIEVAGGRSP